MGISIRGLFRSRTAHYFVTSLRLAPRNSPDRPGRQRPGDLRRILSAVEVHGLGATVGPRIVDQRERVAARVLPVLVPGDEVVPPRRLLAGGLRVEVFDEEAGRGAASAAAATRCARGARRRAAGAATGTRSTGSARAAGAGRAARARAAACLGRSARDRGGSAARCGRAAGGATRCGDSATRRAARADSARDRWCATGARAARGRGRAAHTSRGW